VKLTPKQAAERAGVSRRQIYVWCDERRLAHYRLGSKGSRGRIQIDPADLDRLIEECRQERHGQENVRAAPLAPAKPAMRLRHVRLS
jgi:excisionase family DNA binding protein